jgi:hypothetical protein
MTNEEDHLTSFEARIASLRPSRPELDRDRLMFLAGQASVCYFSKRRRNIAWPMTVTASVAVALTAVLFTVTESASRIVDRVASVWTSSSDDYDFDRAPGTTALADEETHYRIEMGNSLGIMFSFLVDKKSAQKEADESSPSLVHMRRTLLEESMPKSASNRKAEHEEQNNGDDTRSKSKSERQKTDEKSPPGPKAASRDDQ